MEQQGYLKRKWAVTLDADPQRAFVAEGKAERELIEDCRREGWKDYAIVYVRHRRDDYPEYLACGQVEAIKAECTK